MVPVEQEVSAAVVHAAAAAVLEWEAEVAWTPVPAEVVVADVAAVEVAAVWKADRLKFLT